MNTYVKDRQKKREQKEKKRKRKGEVNVTKTNKQKINRKGENVIKWRIDFWGVL